MDLIQTVHRLAECTAEKKNAGHEQRCDQGGRVCPLSSGDRVLIQNLGLHGENRLADRWKAVPDIVGSQIKTRKWTDPEKVLRQNHILPVGKEVQFQSNKTKIPPKPPKRRVGKRLKEKATKTLDLSSLPVQTSNDSMDSASDPEGSQKPALQQHEPSALRLDSSVSPSHLQMEETTVQDPEIL